MTMRRPRRKLAQRGAAAIELALLALPLAALTFGTTEFGRALHQYNTLAKSVRDAARYQTTQTAGDPAVILAARCLALTGSRANAGANCTGTPLLPGFALANVQECDRTNWATNCPGVSHNLQPTGRGVVNLVTVKIVNYNFTSMVPYAMPSITFGAIGATMVQPL